MEPKNEKDLFIYTDEKIEKVKAEVSDVIKSILSQGQKIDQLTERINEGVSKTAFKTWEKVNEISVALNEMKHDNGKRDVRIDGIQRLVEWFYRGLIFILASGIILAIWKL